MSPFPRRCLALLAACGCAACGTLADDERRQTIDVRVESDRPLPLLDCSASNDRGRWSFAAPGPVVVQVSRRPLRIECELPDHGVARARSDLRDPSREGARAGATLGAGMGVAAGAAAAPVLGPGLAAMFVLGGALRGAEFGALFGGATGGAPAYPAVIVVKVAPAP